MRCCGSSPRARGTPASACARSLPGRIIPACAGNTPIPGVVTNRQTDHPRVRGEHPMSCSTSPCCAGSSPRARGTRQRWRGSDCPQSDHPRVRGEHSAISPPLLNPSGSSPRARGTLRWRHRRELRHRIIPACAGNTLPPESGGRTEPDHPRVRGEHASASRRNCSSGGSSPRARGTRSGDGSGAAH